MSESRHGNNFDLMRCLLASLVLVSHSSILLDQPEPLSAVTRGQVEGGELAVNLFFVLSGFLITRSWDNSKGLFDYLSKRVARIYPGYLVAVAFCILIVGPLATPDPGDYFRQVRPLGATYSALTLSGVVAPRVFANPRSPYMNASLWTIPYEFSCYALVAGLGCLGLLRQRGKATVWLLWLLFYGRYLAMGCPSGLPSWGWTNSDAWNRLLMYFLAGAVLRYFPANRLRLRPSSLILLGALGACCLMGGLRPLLPSLGAYVFLQIGLWPSPWLRKLAPRVDISYGIYLYAYPLQQLLIQGGVTNVVFLNLAGLAGAITLGWLSWQFVEGPALRRARNFITKGGPFSKTKGPAHADDLV